MQAKCKNCSAVVFCLSGQYSLVSFNRCVCGKISVHWKRDLEGTYVYPTPSQQADYVVGRTRSCSHVVSSTPSYPSRLCFACREEYFIYMKSGRFGKNYSCWLDEKLKKSKREQYKKKRAKEETG